MGIEYAGGIYIIEASKGGKTEYWAAAVPRDQALKAVQSVVVPGSKLTLTNRRLTPAKIAELKMRPNSVRQLKVAP